MTNWSVCDQSCSYNIWYPVGTAPIRSDLHMATLSSVTYDLYDSYKHLVINQDWNIVHLFIIWYIETSQRHSLIIIVSRQVQWSIGAWWWQSLEVGGSCLDGFIITLSCTILHLHYSTHLLTDTHVSSSLNILHWSQHIFNLEGHKNIYKRVFPSSATVRTTWRASRSPEYYYKINT